jgi:S1-C subfamily serine protease
MDFEEAYRRGIEARPRRTLLGTALRALLAGLVMSGLVIVLAVVFDRQQLPPHDSPPSSTTPARSRPRTPVANTAADMSEQGSGRSRDASDTDAELKRRSSTPGNAKRTSSPGAAAAQAAVVADAAKEGTAVEGATVEGAAVEGATGEGANVKGSAGEAATGRPMVETASNMPSSLDAARLDRLEESIVKIEAGREGEREGVGAGFVIDSRGWIATNYHVLADATAARARFKNGAAYEIAGYAAIDPELDLAIVSLKEPPRELVPLPLADEGDPRRLASVLAIGHPQGVEFSLFDGKVSRVLATAELPRGSQRFVRQLISGSANHRWIQHTAKLSEGNSGGPLVDMAGAVVGINTWVDRQAGFSYSLHVRHLRELRDAVAGQVEPLRDYARKEARVNDLLTQLTPERIDEWLAAAESMGWSPESARDYEVLQQLAWAVTAVKLPDTLAGGRLEERLDPLLRAARKVEQRLAALKWDAAGQVTLINELSLAQVARPMAGVFLFGIVERTVEGDAGERGALVKLAGADQMLFLPLDGQLVVPAPGLQCLILGVNYDGHRIRYGDNPLKLITAHVIASRTLLPLEKPSE